MLPPRLVQCAVVAALVLAAAPQEDWGTTGKTLRRAQLVELSFEYVCGAVGALAGLRRRAATAGAEGSKKAAEQQQGRWLQRHRIEGQRRPPRRWWPTAL
jgi:hypothetical protein